MDPFANGAELYANKCFRLFYCENIYIEAIRNMLKSMTLCSGLQWESFNQMLENHAILEQTVVKVKNKRRWGCYLLEEHSSDAEVAHWDVPNREENAASTGGKKGILCCRCRLF